MFVRQVLLDLTVVVKVALISATAMVFVKLRRTAQEKLKANAIVKMVLLEKDVKGRYVRIHLVENAIMLVVVFRAVASAVKDFLVAHVVKGVVR